jgi:hypothetical protein
MTAAPLLSVVVAHAPGMTSLAVPLSDAAWLRALARSCHGLDAELILVGFDAGASLDGAGLPTCVLVDAPRSALTPVRWARGLDVARGRVVAFTTDACVVDAAWARTAVAALVDRIVAVGGPIRSTGHLSRTARAVYQLRFGRLPASDGRVIPVDDVAADNAAYLRAPLLEHGGDFRHGFWEVDANRRLRAAGWSLAFHGDMGVEFVGGEQLATLLWQRFAHGRYTGAWRIAIGVRRAWQVVVASPLVPFVMLARTLRGGRRPQVPAAIPEFLLLASAWAMGEALGAVAPPRGVEGSRVAPSIASTW